MSGVDIKKIKVEEDKRGLVPEPDLWYPAKFKEARPAEGKHGPIVFLEFELLGGSQRDSDESAKGVQASALVSLECTPTSKLMHFVRTFSGGEEFDTGEEIDLTVWYGKKYDIFVEVKEGKDKQGNSRPMVNVTKISEYKSKQSMAIGEKTKKTKKTKKVDKKVDKKVKGKKSSSKKKKKA